MIEALDLFPTLVDLAGVAPLPACEGDQPPTVNCVQVCLGGEVTFRAVNPLAFDHFGSPLPATTVILSSFPSLAPFPPFL